MYKLLNPKSELLLGCEDMQTLLSRVDELNKILDAYRELDHARLVLHMRQAHRPPFTTTRFFVARVMYVYDIKIGIDPKPYISIIEKFISWEGTQEREIAIEDRARMWRFVSKQRRRT